MRGTVDLRPRVSSLVTQPARPIGARVVRGLLFVGAGLFAGFVVVRTLPAVVESELLPVRNVLVVGADPARVDEVVAYAQVADGAPLFSVDVSDIQQRVTEHPYVREASVRRVPPDTVEIRVVERQAFAVLAAQVPYLLDETMVPFKRVQPGDPVDLPVITGRDAGEPGGRLDEVNVASESARVVLAGGLTVQLGHDQLVERFARLAVVVTRARQIGRVLDFVFLDDARRPERVAVRFRSSTEVSASTGG